VVLERARQGKSSAELIRIGMQDGRVLPLKVSSGAARLKLKVHDVVRVQVTETKQGPQAELRMRPNVQGAALVLENKTGRILAMVGGFSYPVSQLNRTTQAERQPGSSLKPLTYLAALGRGLQPNTLVWDSPISLPPVGGGRGDWWTPKNYDSHGSGIITLRRALEKSKNLVTARLLDGGVASTPEQSLARICTLAKDAHVYQTCVPHYPFVLGAQPVRPIDLATFYASIANEGLRPTPHVIESIREGDRTVYAHSDPGLQRIAAADQVAFYQLKTILQGVLARGTAQAVKHLSPYVAGKTGTTDNENDAWFMGFTNDVTVAIWLGYDNAGGKRRTLGRGATGGRNAVPIFEPIIQAVWAHHAPKTPLAPPSREAEASLVAMPIDVNTGDRIADRRSSRFLEFFRADRSGSVVDTRYDLVSRDQAYAYWSGPDEGPVEEGSGGWSDGAAPHGQAGPPYGGGWQGSPRRPEAYGQPPFWGEERAHRRPRRVDPFWGQIY
jgi:membrane carboxypeptidase/penicillin-binding protein